MVVLPAVAVFADPLTLYFPPVALRFGNGRMVARIIGLPSRSNNFGHMGYVPISICLDVLPGGPQTKLDGFGPMGPGRPLLSGKSIVAEPVTDG